MAWNLVNSCDDVASRMSREIDSGGTYLDFKDNGEK